MEKEMMDFMKEISANSVYQRGNYKAEYDRIIAKEYFLRYSEKIGDVVLIGNKVLVDELIEELEKEFKIDIFYDKKTILVTNDEIKSNYNWEDKMYIELQNGYMLAFDVGHFSDVIKEFENIYEPTTKITFNTMFYGPSSNSKLVDKTVYDKVTDIIRKTKLKDKVNQKSKISMVIQNSNNKLELKNFFLDKYKIDEDIFDLHYGLDFKKFNDNLIEKIKNDTKGLVLLHGEPGTGKTFYVRYLLSQISSIKNVVYFPPTMVETITRPDFLDFISEWKDTVILIEDAEPLLVERNSGRNLGITNLLNLTDGILNDLFNIQIVATFNTRLDKLDPALLRPERLIARKEFTKLALNNAVKLAEKLLISKEMVNKEMTLAEIYSLKNENNAIMHEIKEKPKVGFKLN